MTAYTITTYRQVCTGAGLATVVREGEKVETVADRAALVRELEAHGVPALSWRDATGRDAFGSYVVEWAPVAEEAPAVAEGATVEVVKGFAANMTGTVEAVEVTETFGRRVLVALPCYGPRWLTVDFVRPIR
ncbi:hypothetical protein ACFWDN_21385 [Micromonospora chalcea]